MTQHNVSAAPGAAPATWRSVNITPVERWGRILIGLAAIAGALGHCPLYRKLGYVPRSFRRTR